MGIFKKAIGVLKKVNVHNPADKPITPRGTNFKLMVSRENRVTRKAPIARPTADEANIA